MSDRLSRERLLKCSIGGGAALLLPASRWTAAAEAADAPPDGDLAYLRLLIGAELLAIDFQTRALAARHTSTLAPTLRRSLADEQAHYTTLSGLLKSAGQTSARAGDVDFSYPRGTFASRAAIAKLGWRIETLLLGAYLGAIGSIQTPEVRLPVGQIAANEAQHLSALAPAAGKSRIGRAFPPTLTIGEASAGLDGFES